MLTEQQRKDLETLKDQLALPIWSTKVSTMNELLKLELVELRTVKGDRQFWYLTQSTYREKLSIQSTYREKLSIQNDWVVSDVGIMVTHTIIGNGEILNSYQQMLSMV